jgi:branched-chain amino acid transport system permease protein
MDLVAVLTLEILNGIATLVLISVGLAIIFGMMRVINLAHGEFLMLGGYAAIVATNHGVNIWVAMLVVAPIVVGIIGVIAERLIIRVLYGRMIDTLLATWGLSLFFIGIVTTIFGNTVAGIGAPLGSLGIGRYSMSVYRLVLVGIAAVMLVAIFVVLRRTTLGLIARATMEKADMAAALGVSPPRVYAMTFGIGAAVTGLAGGLLAPISGVLPTVGAAYVAKAFITVISGGTAIVAGTAAASGLFGSVNQALTYFTTPVIGEAGLLVAAILLLRVLPHGITGKLFRGSL